MEDIIIDAEIITRRQTPNRSGIRFHLLSLSILFCNRIRDTIRVGGKMCKKRRVCVRVCETFFLETTQSHNEWGSGILDEISLRDFLRGSGLRESSGRNLNNYTLIKVATKIPFDPSGDASRSLGDKRGREIVAITIFCASRNTCVPWSRNGSNGGDEIYAKSSIFSFRNESSLSGVSSCN